MADIDPRPIDVVTSDAREVRETSKESRKPIIVWLVVSAGFLAYLAFGSIEIRIWSFGRLFFQDRKIAHVWSYFGDRLPDMPGSPLIPILYYLSLFILITGTVVGLWYFLVDREDQEPPRIAISLSADTSLDPKQNHG